MLRNVFNFFFAIIQRANVRLWLQTDLLPYGGKHVLRRGQRVTGEMMDVLDVNDTIRAGDKPLHGATTV